jgi:hypothetical protein
VIKGGRRATAVVLFAVLLTLLPSTVYADGGPYGVGSVYQVKKFDGSYEQFRLWYTSGCPQYTYTIQHQWQTSSGWSGWYGLGGCAYSFDVGMNYDGREEIFVLGSDFSVWHDWQENPGSGPWSGWYVMNSSYVFSHGPWTGSYMSPNWQPYMHVYASINGGRFVNYQTSPGCCWSGWHAG